MEVFDKAKLKQQLSPLQYEVCVNKGTERPFTGAYWDHHEAGAYLCAVCGSELFASKTKFESGTGWPSFWAPVDGTRVAEKEDRSLFMRRIDGVRHLRIPPGARLQRRPEPTGLRYCINSASLKFKQG